MEFFRVLISLIDKKRGGATIIILKDRKLVKIIKKGKLEFLVDWIQSISCMRSNKKVDVSWKDEIDIDFRSRGKRK